MADLARSRLRGAIPRVAVVAACASIASDASARQDLTALLEMQTQAMLDAVAAGETNVWDRYLDPAMIYLAEDGRRKGKADLLNRKSSNPFRRVSPARSL